MNFEVLTASEDVSALIGWHNLNSKYVVCDFETTDKDPRKAKLIDIQMSGRGPKHVVMFGAEHLPLLLGLKVPLVWWNMKYDLKVAYFHGTDLRVLKNIDAMLIDHLVDENRDHDLDSHVQAQFGDDYKAKFWSKYANYLDAPIEERIDYGCRDIYYTDRVYQSLLHDCRVQGIPDSLVDHVHRLALSLLDTEIRGIRVDLDYTIQMGADLKADIVKTQAEMRKLGGFQCEIVELDQWSREIDKAWTAKGKKWITLPKPEFNFGSSAQVAELLYRRLKLPVQINRKTRQPTADDDALEALESRHPLIPELRKYRKYTKMYGAFIEGVLDKVQDGRIYPGFNVNGTVTGRLSHTSPNMAQMPSKGEWAKIRGIFIPDPGHKIVTCDYGQLEVCIAAHFSMDKNLLKIIHEGASKHDITAESLGVPRPVAKTLNFALQYQCSARKVAEIIGCSQDEGEYYWNKYWETYAGEKKVIDECKAIVDRGDPIVNPFGRQRHFPKEFANHWEREAAYRQAYSSKIQGTGADLTSRAFYIVDESMKWNRWGTGLFTVHDELLLHAKDRHVEETRQLVQHVMVEQGEVIELRVPLTVDCSDGLERWTK